MSETRVSSPLPLTGRIHDPPHAVVHEEVLGPQFRYEVEHLLDHYVAIEKALLLEYRRLGLLDAPQVRMVAAALGGVSADALAADPAANLSDIAFAVERTVVDRLPAPVPAWHVDRSRNDLQACAQRMLGRERTLWLAEGMLACAAAAQRLAARYRDDPMPGYTHLQPAQVITPAFWLLALSAHLLHALRRLLATYDGFNLSPLGCGAMAGQELGWDRDRLARLLAFDGPEPHALVGVASRGWLLELAGECATFGVGLSRFVTDLMAWSSGAYGFVSLPDELAAISSAMPQKRNYPLLERIRGRTAHLAAWYVDVATAQRGTPFSNTVEVSKEGGAQLAAPLATLRSALRLLTTVLDNLVFDVARTRERCAGEHLGGFSLANRLTLLDGVPWRDAQVIAGRYVVAAEGGRQVPGTGGDPPLLHRIAAGLGYLTTNTERLLAEVLDPDAELRRRRSPGSASPAAVTGLLRAQEDELSRLTGAWEDRAAAVATAAGRLDQLLGPARSPT